MLIFIKIMKIIIIVLLGLLILLGPRGDAEQGGILSGSVAAPLTEIFRN